MSRRKKPPTPQPMREPSSAPRVRAVPLSQVAPTPVRFLVEPYLPLGTVNLLEGDPGTGKSTLAAAIGAAVTRGRAVDMGIQARGDLSGPRSVLYVTNEDRQATLRARFEAHGADLDRVLCVSDELSLRDVDPLRQLVEDHQPALVVVDPLHALLAGVNMSSANGVRVALTPLVTLAAKHDLCVLGIRHLAKASSDRTMYRGLGSIDFAAIARSVLRAGVDPCAQGERALVHVKCSVAPLGPSVEYELGDQTVTWLGRSELTAADLDARGQRTRGRSALEVAEDFLEELLRSGAKPAAEVVKAARDAGIAERTLERAEKSVGIRHLRVNEGGEGRGRGHWVWSLPAGGRPDAVGDLETSL